MSRDDPSRLPWWLLISPFVLALAGLAAFIFLADRPAPGDDSPPSVPAFAFEVQDVRVVPVGREPDRASLRKATRGMRRTLDSLYVRGFVDPAEWEDGTFPRVLELFGRKTARQAREDLQDLTLGPTARRVTTLEPKEGTLDLEVLVDAGRRPYAAVATVYFRGRADLSGAGLRVEHRGRYLLRRLNGGWAIVGYRVEGTQETLPARQETPS